MTSCRHKPRPPPRSKTATDPPEVQNRRKTATSVCLVGPSLLTAAVCGNVFASPPTQHVLAALEQTRRHAGAILFVINYTGDRLNFGLAAERFRESGGKARLVSIADDVAIEGEGRSVGRRGLAAATFVIKDEDTLVIQQHPRLGVQVRKATEEDLAAYEYYDELDEELFEEQLPSGVKGGQMQDHDELINVDELEGAEQMHSKLGKIRPLLSRGSHFHSLQLLVRLLQEFPTTTLRKSVTRRRATLPVLLHRIRVRHAHMD